MPVWGLRLEQTKPPFEVALRVVVFPVRTGPVVLREVPCEIVMARAEEEKRARPRNWRWGSRCIVSVRNLSVLVVQSSNERCNDDWEVLSLLEGIWPFIKSPRGWLVSYIGFSFHNKIYLASYSYNSFFPRALPVLRTHRRKVRDLRMSPL